MSGGVRLVDVVQVLLQEPQAAAQQAELIAVDAQMKEVVQRKRIQDDRRRRKTVTKLGRYEARQAIKTERISKGLVKVRDPQYGRTIDISA